jgi:hypothetical protein
VSRTLYDSSNATREPARQLKLAEILDLLTEEPVRFRFTAYDGSSTGPADATIRIHLNSHRGAAYLATAPGSLGMARAYVMGDLEVSGVHPGDPYPALRELSDSLHWRRPHPRDISRIASSAGSCRSRHRRRRRQHPTGDGCCRGDGILVSATQARSRTTTTCPTGSTSSCSDRR